MSNYIDKTAIVEDNVLLGDNNYIGAYCTISNGTVIGNNNRFEAYCSIGTPPEHREYFKGSKYGVQIGNNCIFREFVTINAGTKRDTFLNNDIVMLRGSHVGHDSIIGDWVNLSCNVLIGGHSYLMEGVNMGLGAICHQFSLIGAYSMLGMGAVITKSSQISPGEIHVGNPAKFLKANTIGLNRNGIDPWRLNELMGIYLSLRNNNA